MQNREAVVKKKEEELQRRDEKAAASAKALATAVHEKAEAVRHEHETEKRKMKAQAADIERELALRNKELEKARAKLEAWRAQLCVESDRDLPSVASGDARSTFQSHRSAIKNFSRQKKFVESVLKERNPEVIASAIASAGGDDMLKALAQTSHFQPLVQHVVQEAADKIKERWNARHSLHVMTDLSLSRELFEVLRHLLSFIYHPPVGECEDDNMGDELPAEEARGKGGDFYERLVLYENPFNKRQKIDFPALQPRAVREAEQALVLGTLNTEQSDCGQFAYRKDLVASAECMLTQYWGPAIRRGVRDGTEKLLIVAFGDATGGWGGEPITHFEIGIGSFAETRAQSKVTLQHALVCAGKDDAKTIRARAQPFTDGLMQMHEKGELRIFPRTEASIQVEKKVPIDVRMAGDFQIIKAMNNQSPYTSAIFCECSDDKLFEFPSKPVADYKAVLKWIEKQKCVVKTLERVCHFNGYSYEVHMGKPFKPFDCGRACKAKHRWRTKAEWTKWLQGVLKLEGAALKEFNREWGSAHLRHWPGFAPVHKFPSLIYFSVDILHAAFINYFKMLAEPMLFAYFLECAQLTCSHARCLARARLHAPCLTRVLALRQFQRRSGSRSRPLSARSKSTSSSRTPRPSRISRRRWRAATARCSRRMPTSSSPSCSSSRSRRTRLYRPKCARRRMKLVAGDVRLQPVIAETTSSP